MEHLPILTITTFAPLVGIPILALLPKAKVNLIRWVALLATLPSLAAAAYIFFHFDRGSSAIQMAEGPLSWIPLS